MTKKRRRHSDEFTAKVALEAVRGVKTLSELSAAYGVHPTVIAQWKRQLLDGASGVFSGGNGAHGKSEDEISAPLYEEIGRLKMELDWLKKSSRGSPRGQTDMDRSITQRVFSEQTMRSGAVLSVKLIPRVLPLPLKRRGKERQRPKH